MNERDKILEKAKKLKALADRGVGGEQINAKDMYEKYCAKHNISVNELNSCQYESSEYLNMTDEQFLQEMMIEAIPLIFDMMFSSKSNNNAKDNFFRKFIVGMAERANKKTKS